MSEPYGTRTDCTRDNRQTICPNSSLLGFSTRTAKRGSWVTYEDRDGGHWNGRVVGRVHCEGKTYIELIQLSLDAHFCYVRWIEPPQVKFCYAEPPAAVMAFLMGEWTDADTILRRAHNGVRNP